MVCRQQLPTLKMLRSHYAAAHSKAQLVRALLKNTVYRSSSPRKTRDVAISFDEVRPQYLKSEILYLEDGFQNSILEDEDSQNSVFEESTPEVKEEAQETDSQECAGADDKSAIKNIVAEMEEEAERKRKENLLTLRNFRFDKSLRESYRGALNEQTGLFYVCKCSDSEKSNHILDCYRKFDLENLKSDTDSCSDDGRSFYLPLTDPKCYCDKCGNGYTSKKKLIKHFEVHNTNCHICKKRFGNHSAYKQHMKKHLLKVFVCHSCGAEFAFKNMLMDHLDAHIEDDIYENVFGLEQDYKTVKNQFCYSNFGFS